MRLLRWLKLWIACLRKVLTGYSRFSHCWLGLHRWDMPGGHCEKCFKCDEFFESHSSCPIKLQQYLKDGWI